MAEPC